jgi:O-antigen ligase
MAVILIALAGLLPLLLTPGILFHYDVTPKNLLLCVALAAALLRFRSVPSEVEALWRRKHGRMLTGLAVMTIVWFGIAALFSSRVQLSLTGSGWREFGVAGISALFLMSILATGYLCANPGQIMLVLRAATAAGFLVSLYGIGQYFDLDPFQPAAGYHALDGDFVTVRPPGTFGHADYFGWWLAIDFFCALAVRNTSNRFWRVSGTVTAVLVSVATILTGTRAALLAIMAGIAVLLFLSRPRIRVKYVLAGGIAVVLLAAFLLSSPGERLRSRMVWIGHEQAGPRPLLWRDSIRMAAAKPLLGYGPDTFSSAFPPFESDELAHRLPDFHHESPHNLLLDALTSAGLPGGLLILGWALLAFRAGTDAARFQSSAEGRDYTRPLAAGLAASAVAAMFNAAVMPPLLLTLMMLGALIATERAGSSALSKRPVFAFAGMAVPVTAGIVAFACILGVSDYRLARFQAHPGAEQYRALLNTPVRVAAEDIYASRILASSCGKLTPVSARFECFRTATSAAARATTTADDPANAWYNLAQFTAAQNDVRGTRMALSRAIAAAPHWFKPHWAMAELLAQTGEVDRARAEATQAAALDSNHTPELTLALTRLNARLDR